MSDQITILPKKAFHFQHPESSESFVAKPNELQSAPAWIRDSATWAFIAKRAPEDVVEMNPAQAKEQEQNG